MSKQCGKMRIFVYDKERILEYAKKNIEEIDYFEIDYYEKKFKYNGESLDEIASIFERWHQSEILIKMNYEREKTKQNREKLKEITENFLLSEIESDDDVLKFLFEANVRLEKVRKKFPGAIKPDWRSISDKLRKNGYTSNLKTSEELKNYKNDYEIMVCLSKNRELVAKILISDTMKNLCSFGTLDPKIGRGIKEYYYRYIKKEELEKTKVKIKK